MYIAPFTALLVSWSLLRLSVASVNGRYAMADVDIATELVVTQERIVSSSNNKAAGLTVRTVQTKWTSS